MTIESVVIIIVGSLATLFCLTFAWRLWTSAAMLAIEEDAPLGPPMPAPAPISAPLPAPPAELGDQNWMGWHQPGTPQPPPSPERIEFERSKLEPVREFMPSDDDDENFDKARTMFFVVTKDTSDRTEIIGDGVDPFTDDAELDLPEPAKPNTPGVAGAPGKPSGPGSSGPPGKASAAARPSTPATSAAPARSARAPSVPVPAPRTGTLLNVPNTAKVPAGPRVSSMPSAPSAPEGATTLVPPVVASKPPAPAPKKPAPAGKPSIPPPPPVRRR